MVARLRRFFDVRSGEGLRVLLSFLYIAVVAAAFLLARPIRNGLFLQQYGPYALVYAYASVSIVLSVFVAVYARVTARFGLRRVTIATLIFFSINVVLFWYAFEFHADAVARPGSAAWLLPARVLRVGELLRRHRAGAGVELRQLAVRHAAGASGCSGSSGRARRWARLPPGCWRGFWSVPSAARSTCCWCSRRSSWLAAAIVALANARLPAHAAARRGRRSEHPFADTMKQIAAKPLPAADGGARVPDRHRDAVDRVSAEPGCRSRSFGGDADALTAILRDVQFRAGRSQFSAAAHSARPGAAALRPGGHDSRAADRARRPAVG